MPHSLSRRLIDKMYTLIMMSYGSTLILHTICTHVLIYSTELNLNLYVKKPTLVP